jgi:hypothetical protein
VSCIVLEACLVGGKRSGGIGREKDLQKNNKVQLPSKVLSIFSTFRV